MISEALTVAPEVVYSPIVPLPVPTKINPAAAGTAENEIVAVVIVIRTTRRRFSPIDMVSPRVKRTIDNMSILNK